MVRDPVAYAHELASAFAADLAESPTLTAVVRERRVTQEKFKDIVFADVQRSITGAPGPNLFPHLRVFVRRKIDALAVDGGVVSGLGAGSSSTIGDLSSLGSSLVGAIGAVWGAKIQSTAIKNLSKVQLQEAQLAERSQEIALERARIENATAQGLPGFAVTGGGASSGPIGIPAAVEIGGTSVPVATLALSALAVIGGGWYAFHGR